MNWTIFFYVLVLGDPGRDGRDGLAGTKGDRGEPGKFMIKLSLIIFF